MTPCFVPFESMSDAEQREHLRDCHGDPLERWPAKVSPRMTGWHLRHHAGRLAEAPHMTPHTHDKPTPRPEENRRPC